MSYLVVSRVFTHVSVSFSAVFRLVILDCVVFSMVLWDKTSWSHGSMLHAPLYYSVEEAAQILGVDAETVRRWCRQGKIPGVRRFGREYRIPRTAIDPQGQPSEEEKK